MIEESLKQLKLLGYKEGDRVFIRQISENGKANKIEVAYPRLPTLSSGRNVYVVVNGGGNTDIEVTKCRAIFYEHDDLDKSVQRDLWRSLGLPEPTFQIDTGGKSVHSYWVFDNPIVVDLWRSLQSDLLEFADADRTIKNPSRIMRLAGSIHQGTGKHAITITQSGQRYTFDKLRAIVPVQSKLEPRERPQRSVTLGAMPLTTILAPKHRTLIESGGSEGYRNSAGAALARDLVGCENWLRASAIQFDGSAESLFQDYCNHCNPPLDTREQSKIWKSAVNDNPTPCLAVDKLLGCVQAWEKRATREQKIHQPRTASSKGKEFVALKSEIDFQITQASEDFPLAVLLPNSIANPLIQFAQRLNAPQGIFGSALLTICASLLKVGIVIRLPGGTGHTEPPILWTCAFGESGNAKTPIQKILLKGLDQLSSDSYLRWQSASEQYKLDLLNWEAQSKKQRNAPAPKPPNRRIYKINNLTTEGVILKQSQQPENGFLIAVDELAGFFKSLNQYKNGGDDLEAWLSFYDGGGVEQVRVSREDIYLENVGFSVFGGIQPCKLKKAMGTLSDQDGFWPRYAFFRVPTQRMPNPEDLPDIDISKIEQLYRRLDNLPKQEYTLSLEAHQVWRDWNSWIEDVRLAEGHEALRVLYPKTRARAARVALVLAAINQAQGNKGNQISAQVLKVAIAFTKWMLRQTLSIYDELGLAENPEADKVTRFVTRFKDSGWIKAKAVTHWSSSKQKLTAVQARDFMAHVVKLGFAKSNDKAPTESGYEIRMIPTFGNLVTQKSTYHVYRDLGMVTDGGNPVVTQVTSETLPPQQVTEITRPLPTSVTPSNAYQERNSLQKLPGYQGLEDASFADDDIDWEESA